MRTTSLALLAAATLVGLPAALAGPPAAAETRTPVREEPRTAHAETDKNKDGRVDREEFHQRLVDVFYVADADKSGKLSEVEFATLDTKTTFAEMDANDDGAVSMVEFNSYRFEQFDDADTDENGALSVEEVEEYVGK